MTTIKPLIHDAWLTIGEVAKKIEKSKQHVRNLVKAGAFGLVGDGTAETPVKRVQAPHRPQITGLRTFIRESAVAAYIESKQAERESL